MIYYAAIAMVLCYYLVFLLYYQTIFPNKVKKVPQVLLTLFFVCTSYMCLNAWSLLVLNFPLVMIIMIIGLRFSTGMSCSQAIYGGGVCAITAYCVRGILTAVSALLYKKYDFLFNANAYYLITLFALPLSLLLMALLRKVMLTDEQLKQFLNNKSQLKLVIVYEFVAVINLVVINSGRSAAPSSSWYMGVALGACALTLFMLIYAIHQSIRSTQLLEYQWRTKELEAQYNRQLQHYTSYQKYTESFRAFRHDYKYMMGTIKSLLRTNDFEKAIQLLDDIYDDMQMKVQIHKKYSDNVALDAVLQDLANVCMEKEIRFSFHVLVPRNTKLSLLDALRIFSNVSNNAVEACEKVPIAERFIQITTCSDQQWVMLEVVNSYNGETAVKNGRLVTMKCPSYDHGMGLGIVEEIAERLGGFVMYDANKESRTFLLRVHVPYDLQK